MKFRVLFLSFFVSISLYSQITITHNDMPAPEDVFIINFTNIQGNSYENTGENFIWDFSNLNSNDGQDSLVFLYPYNAPFSYNLIFIYPFVSNICSPAKAPGVPPQAPIQITDPYDFYKNTTSSFKKVGFAAKINDIPTPQKYDTPENYYIFPLTYGNEPDSSVSFFSMQVPGYGTFGQYIYRKNYVDGWGIVKMPYGNYECIRLKSTIITRDTIFMEQCGLGFLSPPRTSYEYKWLTNNFKIPVIQITKENMISSVKYINLNDVPAKLNRNTTPTSFETIHQNDNIIIKLSGNSEFANVFIFDISGKLFYHEIFFVNGQNEISLSIKHFPSSMYILKAQVGKQIFIEKFFIE